MYIVISRDVIHPESHDVIMKAGTVMTYIAFRRQFSEWNEELGMDNVSVIVCYDVNSAVTTVNDLANM